MTDELPLIAGTSSATREELISALFDADYRNLVGLARLVVDSVAEAEEVVQEGFARLYASFARVDDPFKARAYLRSTVINLARSRLRRRRTVRAKAHLVSADARDTSGDASHGTTLTGVDRERVVAAVRSLPKRQMECVVLRYYYDSNEREIAETLGVSAGSVKKHLSRANDRLRIELEGLA